MSRGGSVPVQVLEGLHDAGLGRAAMFAPFSGEGLGATATIEDGSATERIEVEYPLGHRRRRAR